MYLYTYMSRPVCFSQVENIGDLAVDVTVTFVVPVEMESGFVWSVGLTGGVSSFEN